MEDYDIVFFWQFVDIPEINGHVFLYSYMSDI